MQDKRVGFTNWVIWLLAVVFYLYEFFLRYSPAVMVPELMRAFHVNAEQIGALSAFYLYIYAPMQLPVGVLMDRYGARRLLTFAAFVCGLGGLAFGWSPVLWIAEGARVLMGLGSAFAFVGIAYVSSHWFPKKHLSALIGTGTALGMLGAVGGEGPLSYIVQQVGWRQASYLFGAIGVVLAAVMIVTMRKAPLVDVAAHGQRPLQHMLGSILTVCRSGRTWLNSVMGTLMYATTTGFGGLWGIPGLVALYQIDEIVAGYAVSTFFLGWIVGAPFMGWISDALGSRRALLTGGSVLGFGASAWIIYGAPLPIWLLFVLMFALGLFSSTQLLTFSISIGLNPSRVKATAAAFTNFLVMLGGSIIQPLVGYLLDLSWAGERMAGVPVYSAVAFRSALALFPGSFLLASLLGPFLKEQPIKS